MKKNKISINFPRKKSKTVVNFYNSYVESLENSLKAVDYKQLEKATKILEKKILSKKNIFVCGNGGSAAISNHLVCDYIKLLRTKTSLKPKVVSLSTTTELITAIANDISYDQIFSEQLEYLAEKNDLLILVSSSGNSKNIINAVKLCKKKGIFTIGFSGFSGGYLAKNSDISVNFPVNNYGLAEDSHHILMHIMMQYLRQKYLKIDIGKTPF